MLQQVLLLFHVLISICLITLVLLQQGKGAEMGASFGSGASQTLFGSQGSGSFLFKLTGLFALLFFVTSLGLSYLAKHQLQDNSIQKLARLAQQLPAHTSEPSVVDSNTTQTTKTSNL
jgi:preprotein translocase subunit SecG